MSSFNVPLVLRGKVIQGDEMIYGGRGGGVAFTAPNLQSYIDRLGLSTPSSMADLYALTFEDILGYLDDLSGRMSLDKNGWLHEAFELSCLTSGLTRDLLRFQYEHMGHLLSRDYMREAAEETIGVPYLEGWVEHRLANGGVANVRAFGARSVHIVAGNVPGVSALSIARNAITRGDAIIKTPSNDPLTAASIARTMVEMAPDHPLTRHLSVAYWKGGDAKIEEALYDPINIEKIVAWGGMASITHIAKYVRPGIELITLDPKLSSTIIGKEVFANDANMAAVASALALDVGALNQEGCVNARVVYVECDLDEAGLTVLNRFAKMLWESIRSLPSHISGPAVRLNGDLQDEIEALRLTGDEYVTVVGGGKEGAVLVSQVDQPVDFARLLANRVVNLVPVDDLEVPVRAVTSYTQTIGIWPETLKRKIRDRLALQGAQRIVSLGQAAAMGNHGVQDGIEPLRRMCRWIVDEVPGSLEAQ